MRLKSATIGLVYKKALKIRPGQSKGKEEATEEGAVATSSSSTATAAKPQPPKRKMEAKSTGEITNLMAVDAQRLQDLMSYFSTLVRGREEGREGGREGGKGSTNLMAINAQRLRDLMSYFSTLVRGREVKRCFQEKPCTHPPSLPPSLPPFSLSGLPRTSALSPSTSSTASSASPF